MRIILTGFMGAGKSTVAGVLHYYLNLPVREMDDVSLSLSGRNSINEIFEIDGEKRFRELELEAAILLGKEKDVIISSGGGAVENEKVYRALKGDDGVVFFLEAPFEAVLERLKGDCTRPLFKDAVKAKTLYESRLNNYRSYCDHHILCGKRTPRQIAEEITGILKR